MCPWCVYGVSVCVLCVLLRVLKFAVNWSVQRAMQFSKPAVTVEPATPRDENKPWPDGRN